MAGVVAATLLTLLGAAGIRSAPGVPMILLAAARSRTRYGPIRSMISPFAFATPLALLMGALLLLFLVLGLIAPGVFQFLFNAQFFGADVASLLPRSASLATLGSLVTLLISAWVFAYAWAWLYNQLRRYF